MQTQAEEGAPKQLKEKEKEKRFIDAPTVDGTATLPLAHPQRLKTPILWEIGVSDHEGECKWARMSCYWITHMRPAEYKRSRLPRNRRTVMVAYCQEDNTSPSWLSNKRL